MAVENEKGQYRIVQYHMGKRHRWRLPIGTTYDQALEADARKRLELRASDPGLGLARRSGLRC